MIQIREMQVRDTNAVAEIERQIFSQPWSRQGFLDAVNLGNTVFLVAEENNRIIGYIGMYLAMDEGEITNVASSTGRALPWSWWYVTYRIIKNCRKQRRRKNCSGSTCIK